MRVTFLAAALISTSLLAQAPAQPDWAKLEDETMRHFQALLDSTPPIRRAARSRRSTTSSRCSRRKASRRRCSRSKPHRPNLVARLKGNGSKRPLLLMAHTDVVNVDPKKWTHPPFGATREGGYVYGRGTVDDKDNVVAVLMAHADAQAAERAARSRRHRAVRSRRRGQRRASASSSWPTSTSTRSTPSTATPKAAA